MAKKNNLRLPDTKDYFDFDDDISRDPLIMHDIPAEEKDDNKGKGARPDLLELPRFVYDLLNNDPFLP